MCKFSMEKLVLAEGHIVADRERDGVRNGITVPMNKLPISGRVIKGSSNVVK